MTHIIHQYIDGSWTDAADGNVRLLAQELHANHVRLGTGEAHDSLITSQKQAITLSAS